MDNVKVCASFILPGSKIPAEYSYSKNGKKKKKEAEEEKTLLYKQENIKINKQNVVINLRVPKPARQNLHLTLEAYKYMIAPENPAGGLNTYEWKRLTKNKRVQYHLLDIAKNFQGTLESFNIMED